LDVSVFDYQPYHENEYSTENGADAASADLNKVMRMSYGEDLMYQRLAFQAADIWREWNKDLSRTPAAELPKGLVPEDRLFENCGFLRLSADDTLSQHETTTLANLTKEGMRDTQYVIGHEEDEKRARNSVARHDLKFDALKRKQRGQNLAGVFDSTAGFVRASKACVWAMHLARKCGVKFVLGDKGRMSSLIKQEDSSKIVGIKTADGVSHLADLVVIASKSPCGHCCMNN
jgi:sarcosine oxidase/L-pipecolate oxidase